MHKPHQVSVAVIALSALCTLGITLAATGVPRRIGAAVCTATAGVPAGYANPCPNIAVGASTLPAGGSLAITVQPPAGSTTYTYKVFYVSESARACPGKVGVWCPLEIVGPHEYGSYVNGVRTHTVQYADIANTLSAGPHYLAFWDWTWNQSADGGAGCYVGPDGACAGASAAWRLQQFTLEAGGSSGDAGALLLNLSLGESAVGSTMLAVPQAIAGTPDFALPGQSEYVAKVLNADGETIFAGGFSVGDTVIAEGDADEVLDFSQSYTAEVPTMESAIALPALPDAATIVVTDAEGSVLSSQPVLPPTAAMTPSRTPSYAARWLKPENASAAGSTLDIAVVGVGYADPAQFTRDWQAFRSRLLATAPFSTYQDSIVIRVVERQPGNPIFPVQELECNRVCVQGPNYPYRDCAQEKVLRAVVERRVPYSGGILTFIQGAYGGCAYLEPKLGAQAWFAFVNTETPGVPGAFSRGLTVEEASDLSARTAVHEYSHLFRILDEYSSGSTPFISGRNCAQSASCSEWTANASIPASVRSGAACAQGCAGQASYYRSSSSSLMRELTNGLTFMHSPIARHLIEEELTGRGVGAPSVQDTSAPTVTLTDPQQGSSVQGLRTLWALASDDVGVTRLEFLVDGQSIGIGNPGIAPGSYSRTWDSRTAGDGAHAVGARAYDLAGNVGQAQSVSVTIYNAPACSPETDAAFCARFSKNCGALSGIDNCSRPRTVASCGACATGTCGGGGVSNVCGAAACTAETDAAFCARLGKNCGPVAGNDNCGRTRTVANCGTCTSGTCGGGGASGVCGTATCTPETDAAFCARLGKNCGSIVSPDNCSTVRIAACGSCSGSQVCSAQTMNVCGTPKPISNTFAVDLRASLSSFANGAAWQDAIAKPANVSLRWAWIGLGNVPPFPDLAGTIGIALWCNQPSTSADLTQLPTPDQFRSTMWCPQCGGGTADAGGLFIDMPRTCAQYSTPGTYTLKVVVKHWQVPGEESSARTTEDRVTVRVCAANTSCGL